MKRPILLSLLVSAGLPAALLTCLPATAQVTSNDEALPQAAPKPASKQVAQGKSAHDKKRLEKHHEAPAHHETGDKTVDTTAPHHAPPSHVPAAKRVGPPPDVPANPPHPVVIPPPGVKVPTHPPVPPEDVKADPKATGKIEARPNGLRILFDANSSGMSQPMIDAVKEEAKKLATRPTVRVTLWASASGSTEDLSTPRRIALTRALVVRALLIREGVATTRIYPRATGLAAAGSNPPDRLDIVAEGSIAAPLSEAQFGTAPRTTTP